MAAGDTRLVVLEWRGGSSFEGGAVDGPHIRVDSEGQTGPSPMEALLLAAAGCTGADVVMILEKMRAAPTACRVTVTGQRRQQEPRRYVAVRLRYELSGASLDEAKARRAIELSLEKYCSVIHSLAPDIATTYELVLV